jgi:hypothetical protein
MADDGELIDVGAVTMIDDLMIDDDVLTELALAADPDAKIDPDAVPFGLGDRGAELLPDWYMPGTLHGSDRHRVSRSLVVGVIVASMLIVNGVGICVTYGIPEVGDRLVPFW